MKRFAIAAGLCWLVGASAAFAAEDASGIIRKADENHLFKTQEFKATMVITKGKQTLTKKFFGYARREGNKSFMEFTNPEDQGVKYLKLEDEMWIYFPDADDVLRISGHLLRQGMMGSDLSYEDMLENESWEEKYEAKLLSEVTVRDRPCYQVELNAKRPDATYARQVFFIDRERYVPLEVEMYARGGRLLKTLSQGNVRRCDGRWIATETEFKDLRRKDSRTVITFDSLVFDQAVPDKVFSKRYLKR